MPAESGPHARLPDGIRLVMFDLAGTTVSEGTGGGSGQGSLVEEAFVGAFARAGLEIAPGDVRPHRGREKLDAIRSLLAERSGARGAEGGRWDGPEAAARDGRAGAGPPDDGRRAGPEAQEGGRVRPAAGLPAAGQAISAEAIHRDFLAELARGMDRFREVPGAAETFRFLKARGIRVGVGSGFPAEVVERLVTAMGWREEGLVDYLASAESLGAGRPDPVMIVDAMRLCGVPDPASVVKVGDTVLDVGEGRGAGSWTVGVLTGAHGERELREAGAHFVLPSVAELPRLFG